MTVRAFSDTPAARTGTWLSAGRGSAWMGIIVPGALTGLLLSLAPSLSAQDSSSAPDREARALIERMRSAERGPFSHIRWFCADGTVYPPRPGACAEHGGGVQHGELSSDARRLAELGYHVGTLLVALPFEEFLDAADNYDRLRQIVLQSYLERVDDGWVYRKARFYRGSRQIEDEEAAGAKLLTELLADAEWVRSHFLLALELVRAVPHGRAPAQFDRIRQLATEIGDAVADFQPIRTKIHSYPDAGDIAAVEEFFSSRANLEPRLLGKLEELLSSLRAYYSEDARERLDAFVEIEPFRAEPWRGRLADLQDKLARGDVQEVAASLVALSARLRREVEASTDGTTNLRRLDLSLTLQEILVRHAGRPPVDEFYLGTASGGPADEFTEGPVPELSGSSDAMSRVQALGLARRLATGAYGRGLLSRRELEAQLNELESLATAPNVSAMAYHRAIVYLQRASKWAQATVDYYFGSMVDRYHRVEPATQGFAGDLLRSTVLLPLANLADILTRDANRELGLTHTIFDNLEGGVIRGLNPGVASGILEFVSASAAEPMRFRPDRIYVLTRSLPELPAVAGILTLSEGSSLSHLQLLARSLGIPNGVIPPSALELIRPYFGKEVLYVVSPLGTVILKEVAQLSVEERRLLAEKREAEFRKLRIDPTRLNLAERRVLSLDELDLDDPYMIVGPKAAGVAKLRREFSDRVAPGLVVPFGVFRAHLDRRPAPGAQSLYEEMLDFYGRVVDLDGGGPGMAKQDTFIEERLAYFREEILRRDLDPALVASLREKLAEWGPAGSFGVFVRSDTNVEDLPEFSGAGLNVTVPNQIHFDDVLNAIKRVWASPFTRRAYAWRQSVLQTPEHTYVSVLIQRSVPVDKSGVLITGDLEMGGRGRVTVSASEGLGGVVGGELAESLLILSAGKPHLLAQAKAPLKRRLRIDGEGGIEWVPTSGSDRVLSEDEIDQLLELTRNLDRGFEAGRDSRGEPVPWDVEFGFLAGRLWLFQIRPLASDSRTMSLAGLAALDRRVRERGERRVDLAKLLAIGS